MHLPRQLCFCELLAETPRGRMPRLWGSCPRNTMRIGCPQTSMRKHIGPSMIMSRNALQHQLSNQPLTVLTTTTNHTIHKHLHPPLLSHFLYAKSSDERSSGVGRLTTLPPPFHHFCRISISSSHLLLSPLVSHPTAMQTSLRLARWTVVCTLCSMLKGRSLRNC